MHSAIRLGLSWLHPSHRTTMRCIARLLLLLAFIQVIAWLSPTPDSLRGIAGYLPMHILFETLSIVIAMLVFAVGWNARDRNQAGNIVLLACVFFTVGWLDFSHTLSYTGMPDFITPSHPEKGLDFWLAARFLASIGLLVVVTRPWHPFRSGRARHLLLTTGIILIAAVNYLVLFHQNDLPRTFIIGQGLTPLKIELEYLFIGLNLITALALWFKMKTALPFNAALLFGAVCVMAMSEFFFTLYATMTDIFNVLGHIYKVIAYLLIYRAIVVETIEAPYLKLAEARQNLALAVQSSNTGLWDWELASNEVHYSAEWKAQLGYQPDELEGNFATWKALLHPEDLGPAVECAERFLASPEVHYENEFRMLHRDGSYRWILARGEKHTDASGKPIRLIGSHIDVSSRKLSEQHIQKLANFDALTGLPNRLLLNDRASQAISTAKREHTQLAVLFVDLDRFKSVNDTLGHHVGDALLIQVSERLLSMVRDNDTVSRVGGDEFVLVLPNSDADGVAHVTSKLLNCLAQPYQIEQIELVVTPSIGIAMYPGDGEDFSALYQHADVAMYRAKQEGRNGFCFYTEQMQANSARTLLLENALRHAINRRQLHLAYQPQVSVADGRIIGVEALLRWQHPEHGAISPAEFIPIAENSGQIIGIGEWVLRTAVQQLKSWMNSGLPPMVMAVNLSAMQFRQPDLPGLITRILEASQLPPQYLELELTEGVTMNDPLAAIAIMNELHRRGVRMSIDDFGTGYSSLSYLNKFKIYKLKIDQSFVRNLLSNKDDSSIVSAIIQLSHTLNFQTIAEGVETPEQYAFLRDLGCDEIQGYHFSRPLAAEALEKFIRGRPQSEH